MEMLNPLLKNIVKIQNGDPRAFTQMWASGGHLHRWHPHSSHPDIELQALEGLYSVQLHNHPVRGRGRVLPERAEDGEGTTLWGTGSGVLPLHGSRASLVSVPCCRRP